MRRLKNMAVAVALACGLTLSTTPSRAQWLVLDVPNLVEAIQQVLSWYEQYNQMVDQYNQLVSVTNKLDGARSLGTILNDPTIQTSLPDEMRNAAQLLGGAYSAAANGNIASVLSSYGVTTSNSQARGAANTLSKMEQVLSSTEQRSAQISQLASRVDTSADAKDSMDLLNRNVLEVARVNNDTLKALAAIEGNRRAAELRDAAANEVAVNTRLTSSATERAALGY